MSAARSPICRWTHGNGARALQKATGSDNFRNEAVNRILQRLPSDHRYGAKGIACLCPAGAYRSRGENGRPRRDFLKLSRLVRHDAHTGDILGGIWFRVKTIIPFCIHEGNGMGRSENDIARICPQAGLLKGLAVHGTCAGSAQGDVQNWLPKIGVTKKLIRVM